MLTEDKEGKYIFKTVEGIMPMGIKLLLSGVILPTIGSR
jgi:hypothetical protein